MSECSYHGATSRSLAWTRNSSMGPPHEGSIRRPIAPWANALTTKLHLAPWLEREIDSMGLPWGIDPTTHWANALTTELHLAPTRSVVKYLDPEFGLAVEVVEDLLVVVELLVPLVGRAVPEVVAEGNEQNVRLVQLRLLAVLVQQSGCPLKERKCFI